MAAAAAVVVVVVVGTVVAGLRRVPRSSRGRQRPPPSRAGWGTTRSPSTAPQGRWNGKTYADGDSGATAEVDNVVVVDVHNHGDGNRDVLGAASVQSGTVGSGKVSVYRDGHRLTGT